MGSQAIYNARQAAPKTIVVDLSPRKFAVAEQGQAEQIGEGPVLFHYIIVEVLPTRAKAEQVAYRRGL